MELNVGDRVVAIKKYGCVNAGDEGTFVHKHKDEPQLGVMWDTTHPRKHTCSGHCESQRGWYVPRGYLTRKDVIDLGELPEVDYGAESILLGL